MCTYKSSCRKSKALDDWPPIPSRLDRFGSPTGCTVSGFTVLLYDNDGEEFGFFEGLSDDVKSLLKLQITTEQIVFIGPLKLQHTVSTSTAQEIQSTLIIQFTSEVKFCMDVDNSTSLTR